MAKGCFEKGETPFQDPNPGFNPEGWPVNDAYDPAKDLSVDKESYYNLKDPNNPDRTVGVKKDLGYIGADNCFHYHPQYAKYHG